MNILQSIHGHNDLIVLDEQQRVQLCREIRDFLVTNVSKTGGHLASNLGVVELSVAIETVFDTAADRLVFDVGHQSYVHKLLTGRQADFSSLRQFGGMAGFPKPSESDTDAFTAGHASSSVSVALGMARARTLMKENYHIVTLLGDGAATGGMVYEGLNDAAVSNEPMVVILNDNAMSIDRNVGGMASHLSKLRTKERYLGMKQSYKRLMNKLPGGQFIFRITRGIKDRIRRMLIPTTIFEAMGFSYLGPVDGHDTENLISLLRLAKEMKRPVLLHVLTQKGRGYEPAERNPRQFHGVGRFDPATGVIPAKVAKTFSDSFGEEMCRLASEDNRVCAITAAMPGGTGLLAFKEAYFTRTFDVGIAEEHAVSMAGGLAKQGMIPVVALYSTFLQRAYDMILQDICLQKLHVVFAIDRAGLVGDDGETHHGVFDIGFLRQAPGMMILCPASMSELAQMLRWAVLEYDGPVALRYPRGTDGSYVESAWDSSAPIIKHCHGDDISILTYGVSVNDAVEAARILRGKGINASVIRLTRVEPLPISALEAALAGCKRAVVLEESCDGSCIYADIAWNLPHISFTGLNLGKQFTTHGSVEVLHRAYGLDPDSVARHVMEVLDREG